MANDAADLSNGPLKPPPAARPALVDSLDEEVDQDADNAWSVEIAHRAEELKSGVLNPFRGKRRADNSAPACAGDATARALPSGGRGRR